MNPHVIVETDGEQPECTYGPFESHQEANRVMQCLYDKMAEADDFMEGDDSDASHFYAETEEIGRREWHIFELSDPEC